MLETLIIIFGSLSIACMFAALWLARREVESLKEENVRLMIEGPALNTERFFTKIKLDVSEKLCAYLLKENRKLSQELAKYKRKRDSHGRFIS